MSTTKTNLLMLFRQTICVYCENHTKDKNTLCGENREFRYVNASGIYTDHWALKC
jgi:thioredoxin-related protein